MTILLRKLAEKFPNYHILPNSIISVMTSTKVLFLGPKGTYSHQAAIQQFQDFHDIEYIPAQSIPECFSQLEINKEISYCVVPLENSTNGQVVFSYDLMRDRMLSSDKCKESNQVIPKLEIIGEQYVSITHCLISPISIPDLKQLADYKTIRIFSHPQVWGQVSHYVEDLKKRCKNTMFVMIDSKSTSDGVLQSKLAQSNVGVDESVLNIAIAAETAALIYDTHVIDHSINDKLGNTTRFLVLQRRNERKVPVSTKERVSWMTFSIEQDYPGSLVDVLTILKDHSVNMCSIHSRPYNIPNADRKWQYLFYIEYTFSDQKENWHEFYNQIDSTCKEWCLWGTFPRNDRYYE